MMKNFRNISHRGILLAVFLLVCTMTVSVVASPSISSLHETETEVSVSSVSADGTNTAEVLSEEEIFTSEASAESYMKINENGEAVETPLSRMVKLSSDTLSEVGENGSPIPEEISTVEEIIESYCETAGLELPESDAEKLSALDQLTYWQDFKYVSTGKPVVTGKLVEVGVQIRDLDNGYMEVTMNGGELLRSGSAEDYLILLINAATGELHFLTMKSYDAETGLYTVDFPCIGPYMITFNTDR